MMDDVSKSWFTGILKAKDSYWAISRSFSQTPRFGVLWWSNDGVQWFPVHYFDKIPLWLRKSENGDMISVGFGLGGKGIYVYKVPDSVAFLGDIKNGPRLIEDKLMLVALRLSREYIDCTKDWVRHFIRIGL